MNTKALTGFVFLVSLMMTTGIIPAKAQQTDKSAQRVRFVCQAFDQFDYEFRNRVMILEQTSTKTLDTYSNLDQVDGSSMIDLDSKATYMGVTGTAEFRMRFYIGSLISESETEEEIIEELVKKPGDFRVAKYDFQDPAPMDYIATGYRDGPTFYFHYDRVKDERNAFFKTLHPGFTKYFNFNLAEFYRREVFDIDNLRDFDTDALKELEQDVDLVRYPYVQTSASSTILMEDGNYICRKPELI